MIKPVLEFQKISMQYGAGKAQVRQVLSDVSFRLDPGKTISLVGRSGSGKSTLLHLAAGILVPTGGSVFLDGKEMSRLNEQGRTDLRSHFLGLVFQFFHLLPHLSVGENVALPGWVAGSDHKQTTARVLDLLSRVGLAERAHDPVGKLSGGEMQRVAICRALLLEPKLILADEPTGSLDDTTGHQIMDLLMELVKSEGGALLYVTHSRELARAADQVWELHDGRLQTGNTA
jgi:putative ABC transport system ATP-binding protein